MKKTGQEKKKQRVLFICTHNSARSQMAEGLMNALYKNLYEAHSAGTRPSSIHPSAIKVMSELGIDISKHHSKSVKEFIDQKFDFVITVCNSAKESCPFFPGGKKLLHKSFKDPAKFNGSKEEMMFVFRQVRDEIKDWIEETFSKN